MIYSIYSRSVLSLPLLVLVAISCTEKAGESSGSSTPVEVPPIPVDEAVQVPSVPTDGAVQMPNEVVVSGSLSLGQNVTGSPVPTDASQLTTDQPVELRSLSGDVVATANTQTNGAFTIAIDTSSMSLTQTPGAPAGATLVYELVGIIKKDQDDKVQGIKRTIVVAPSSLVIAPSSLSSPDTETGILDVGENVTKSIGAIKGKVVLEGGASAVGADIYIPGTSFLAKADDSGDFVLTFLNAGTYDVRIENDGYSSFVFPGVRVGMNDTTNLDEVTLSISQGPTIESFVTADGAAFVRSPDLRLHFATKNAVKYKLSQWPDFRYAVYLPIDLHQMPQDVTYVVTGEDGPQTVYLRVADADGLEVDATLPIVFDTTLPTVPTLEVVASESLVYGYTKSRSIVLKATSCKDVAKLFVTETSEAAPTAGEFSTTCSTTDGLTFELSDEDGAHSLRIWAMDATDQVSNSPSVLAVTLDRTAPSLSVSPASGVSNVSISASGTLDEPGLMFYSIDGSPPTRTSSALTGNVILIGNTTLKVIGYDQAGNASTVVTRSYVIDADAPILGSIQIEGGAAITKDQTVTVNLSAINADFYMLDEQASFPSGVWAPYTAAPDYTFQSAANGTKTIYLKFKDAAGNELGKNGELHDSIVFDSVLPAHGGITLYYPESPSGSFDKMLLWQDATPEDGAHYEIEVHGNASYTDLERSGTAEGTSWQVNPVFANTGIYYWRVRVIDAAGNESPWVEGGAEKSFEIKLFGKTYVPTYKIQGADASHSGFGVRMVKRSGANDFYLAAAVKGPGDGCANCPVVELVDWSTKQSLHTFSSGSTDRDAFGVTIEQCDLNNDGVDDIAIGAPLQPYRKTVGGLVRTYSNAGAVYVYDGATYEEIFVYTLDPNYAPQSCNERYDAVECKVYAWPDWYGPDFMNYLYVSGDRQLTGLGLACQRKAGADTLAIGSPGWSNGSYQSVGKVELVDRSGSAPYYTVQGSSLTGVAPANDYLSDQLGRSIVYLNKLSITGHDGPAFAVAAPGRASGGNSRGAVLFYDTSLNLLATISGAADYDNYGKVMVNLGNFDDDSGGYEELAVSGQGVVRIYAGETGGSAPAVLKSIKRLGSDAANFGLAVAAVGDITGDGLDEIAVADPTRQISGNWGAGIVFLYDQTDLDATDASNLDEKTLYKLTGSTLPASYTGQNILPGDDDNSDGVMDSIRISSSGLSGGRGAVSEFALVSMAPTLPSTVEGSATAATYGYRVIAAPDFDADGTNDFVVSSPNINHVFAAVGRVDFVSGKNNGILKTVYGRNANQKLGTDLLYIDGNILVLGQDGTAYRFYKDDILFINDINDYQNGSWDYRYSRRSLYTSSTDHVGFIQEPMNVGGVYTSDSWDRVIGIHSSGSLWFDGATRYGAVGIYDKYYSGNKYASDCVTSGGTDSSCKCMIVGANSGDEFGYSAAFIPDFNGDGLVDIAVGAPGRNNGDGSKGVVYIFDGLACSEKANLTIANAIHTLEPTDLEAGATTSRFGANLYSLGDMDGAGTDNGTLIVANNNWFNTSSTSVAELYFASHSAKRAKLVHGGVTIYAIDPVPADGNVVTITMLKSTAPAPVWTTTCSASGDDITLTLSKDNSDVLIAYPWNIISAIANNAGCRALVAAINTPGGTSSLVAEIPTPVNLSGGTNGALRPQTRVVMPAGSLFGANLANIGDRNKDGYPELAVSIPKAQGMSNSIAGQVVIYSSSTLLSGSADPTYPSNAEVIKFYSPTSGFSNFGSSFAQNDVNGDGIDDFLIGAPLYSSASQDSVGSVSIYYVKGVSAD